MIARRGDRVRSALMLEVRQLRGGGVESVHPVSAARDGSVVFSEEINRETAFRSASEPHQLTVSLALVHDVVGRWECR
jgi:hypothetical protein